MDTLYLLMFLIGALSIVLYTRHWYNRSSGMSEILEVSYSYQTLKFINTYADVNQKDPEKTQVSMNETVEPYMKKRGLNWRQRNDIISYMLKMDWIYELIQTPLNTM